MLSMLLHVVVLHVCSVVLGLPPDGGVRRSDDPEPLQTMVQQMAADMTKLQALVTEQGNQLQQLRAQQNEKVAFTAYIGEPHLNATHNGLVRFSRVITNVGSAYNTNTGVFTTPYDGDYLFLVNIDVLPDYQDMMIMRNGHAVMHGHNDGGAGRNITATVVLALTAGDTVTVHHGSQNDGRLDGGIESTFSGYRLF